MEKLFEMQKQLDKHIESKHQLETEDLFDRKILALLVELGELANETRCFKFWSVKPASEKNTLLEEFVDCLHFILSIGIELQIEEMPNDIGMQSETASISEQFLNLYQAVLKLKNNKNKDSFFGLAKQFFQLSLMLGFTNAEIEQAYCAKNDVNYQRQQEGY